MNISKIIFILFALFKFYDCFGQIPATKSIDIRYVDFTIETDAHVDCMLFESAFDDSKSFTINDSKTIKNILKYITKFKNDTIDNYLPDTRARITIYNSNSNKDIICISNFGICFNNRAILTNGKFLKYIKTIIKQKDSTFNY
jgi:hypothetical protein